MSKSTLPGDGSLSSKDRGEVFALTRALSFTRRAYRTLTMRSRSAPAPATAEVLNAIAAEPALTPWDMIDERDSQDGVAFTFFQQRSEPQATQSAA